MKQAPGTLQPKGDGWRLVGVGEDEWIDSKIVEKVLP